VLQFVAVYSEGVALGLSCTGKDGVLQCVASVAVCCSVL